MQLEAREYAELISLALTAPTLILSLAVVWVWAPASIRAIRSGLATGHDWLILGVCTGFIGGFSDNLYWMLAWASSFMELPSRQFLFEHGVYANIPFRQCMGAFAAYCHLKAGQMQFEDMHERFLNRVMLVSWISAALVVAYLVIGKSS